MHTKNKQPAKNEKQPTFTSKFSVCSSRYLWRVLLYDAAKLRQNRSATFLMKKMGVI